MHLAGQAQNVVSQRHAEELAMAIARINEISTTWPPFLSPLTRDYRQQNLSVKWMCQWINNYSNCNNLIIICFENYISVDEIQAFIFLLIN